MVARRVVTMTTRCDSEWQGQLASLDGLALHLGRDFGGHLPRFDSVKKMTMR